MGNQIKFPIPSFNEYLENKKCNYKTYSLLTLYSNIKPINIQLEDGSMELFRYIYLNKIYENKDEIEKLSKTKILTITRNVRKLSKLNNSVVSAYKNERGEIYYVLNYSTNGKYFVTIEEKILRKMVNVLDSNAIKVYVLLKYLCSNGKKRISRGYMAKKIGLSPKAHKNLKVITDITDTLHDMGLIRKTYVGVDKKTFIYYEVCSYEDWLNHQKNRTNNNSIKSIK